MNISQIRRDLNYFFQSASMEDLKDIDAELNETTEGGTVYVLAMIRHSIIQNMAQFITQGKRLHSHTFELWYNDQLIGLVDHSNKIVTVQQYFEPVVRSIYTSWTIQITKEAA